MHFSLPTTVRTSSPAPDIRKSAWQEALAQARDAIRYGNASEAVRSLSTNFSSGSPAFSDALLGLLDSASGMRQQLIDEACKQCPGFALTALEAKIALDLAVRHKDTEFADYLLRYGANPEHVSLVGATGEMQALVSRWRLKNLLYANYDKATQGARKFSSPSQGLHAAPARREGPPLDEALSEGRYQEAEELLQQKMCDDSRDSYPKLWHAAMNEKQYDVLRAMLMLKPDVVRELAKDQQKVGEWLKELRQDPGLSAALKEFPYQSAKRGAPQHFNYTVQFRSTAELIACRHLSTYQQEAQALHPKIKFDYGKFGNEDAIANNVQPEIEKTFETLKAQASATHLIDNSKFGQFLAWQFQEMEGEDKPATRLMLVDSTNHSMNLGLMIKEKEGKKSYVVKFFDPNDTTTGTRSKASSVQTFEMQTIEDYLAQEWCFAAYYPETKGLSMIFVRPKGGEQTGVSASATLGSTAGRRLTTCIDIKDNDATAVWHFMKNGFAANLRDLQDHLATLSESQRIAMLEGKMIGWAPALFMAMQNGHEKAIKEYGKLLSESLRHAGPIPEQQRIALLEGKRMDGVPALFLAMQYGQAKAIEEYGKLLDEFLRQAGPIPEERCIALLEGRMMNGIPALFPAMTSGHVEAIEAYGKAMKLLPADKQADLLLVKDPTGWSVFGIAVAYSQFAAANAQLQLLVQLAPKLSEGKRAELRQELPGYRVLLEERSEMSIPIHKEMLDEAISTLSKLEAELRNDLAIHE